VRLLLAQALVYLPTLGGANKENRLMLAALSARGHECRVVAPACGSQTNSSIEDFRSALARQGLSYEAEPDADVFDDGRVSVAAVTDRRKFIARLKHEIETRDPDLVLVGSEDPGYALLDTAVRLAPGRVVYVARTTLAVPFGPSSGSPSPRALALLGRVAGVIVVSEFLKRYCMEWAGLPATVLPISPHGPGPFPLLGRYDTSFVTMINPCAFKGLPIFLALARACPDLQFAAVPTWGTTEADLHALREVDNIRVLPAADDIDDILCQTRALVVPSLWAENKARIITEAMLRGVPVLASDVGGNAEAKLGVDYLLPVQPIARFDNRVDERLMPIPIVPPQDPAPWVDALRALLATPESHARVSRDSRAAALAANERESIVPVEDYLVNLALCPS
jgi:glycosyltransferase involved in cell wall biosynthesis